MGQHKPHKTKISDSSRAITEKEKSRAESLKEQGLTARKDRRKRRF